MEIHAIASGSSGNCFLISDGKTKLLLDAGIPMRTIQEKAGFILSDVEGALITHEHQDHAKSALYLIRRGIDLYTSAGTAKALDLLYHYRVKLVRKLQRYFIGTWEVLPFDVQHDCADPLGFLLTSTHTGEKLLYFTDTYYIKYKFKGLTHIIGECNHDTDLVLQSMEAGAIPADLAPRLVKSHMSLKRFCEFLQANDLSKVKEIHLIHLSNNNADAPRFLETVQKLTGKECYVH